MILCDTGVFFQLFRKNDLIKEELLKIGFGNLALSDLSVGEIYFGMRKGEIRKTKELIKHFRRYHFNKEVSLHFLEIMSDKYGRKISIPDALIAAFSKAYNLELFTLNTKDFRNIDGIKIYKTRFQFK